MKRTALVVCRDHDSLRSISEAFDDLGLQAQICLTADEAAEQLVRNRYSAVVLDHDLPEAIQIAKIARMTAAGLRPVVFAMVGMTTTMGPALQTGINFVLYKPLDYEQLMSSLRSAQSLMKKERRRIQRQKLEAVVYLQFGQSTMPALMLDISEQGLALQAPERLPPIQKIPLRFSLPETPYIVEAMGDLIWTDETGQAGLFFTSMKPTCRKHLKTWLAKRGIKRKDSVRALLQPKKTRRAISTH